MFDRHTRDFEEIEPKSDYAEIFRRSRKFFSKKKFTPKKVPKNKLHCLLADPAKNDIPKNRLRKVKLKKVIGAFFGKCLRMQKAPIKLVKFCHWDIALGCGPGSRYV